MKQTKHHFTASEIRGIILVIFGVSSLIFFYSWWFRDDRWQSPWLWLGFIVALFYGSFQLVGNWLLYMATHHRAKSSQLVSIEALTVDVFVTAYNESYEMVERALLAVCAMRGRHRTWLLDDGENPELARLAEKLRVGYLTRPDRRDAKAGNVNAGLARTEGDIVVIFDIDHAPRPDFLEKTLPYFADPTVGFVQVMLTFENESDGWVARAAAESSLDFYNPTSIGADGMNSATLIGSNALIRRQALEDIGGYRPGLAEDLATSIALHAAGWQSTYVNEPLAPGYAPPDLTAWFTQQLKWARGVFELLLTDYPRYFRRLAPGQRLSYAVRMTYYWVGPVAGIHILLTMAILLSGDPHRLNDYQTYLLYLMPLAFMTLMIRHLALRRWCHPSLRQPLQWKPMALVFATWPIYSLAWLMALLRVPLGFRPTPKRSGGGLSIWWLMPQIITIVLLIVGTYSVLFTLQGYQYVFVLGFAVALALPQLFLLSQRLLTAVNRPNMAHNLAVLQRTLHL